MRAPLEILSQLRERDLLHLIDESAVEYNVTPIAIVGRDRGADIVKARHAAWFRVYHELGENLSATARAFDVDHTSVLYAMRQIPPEVHAAVARIIRVVLATFETDHNAFALVWVAGRVNPFGVVDRVADSTTWFPSHQIAREVFDKCCEEAGAETFRSHSAHQLEADAAAEAREGGALLALTTAGGSR